MIMNRSLIAFIACILIIGCSNNEDNESFEIIKNEYYRKFLYSSPDSIHSYSLPYTFDTFAKGYAESVSSNDYKFTPIWEKNINKPDAAEVDLGYGEKLKFNYCIYSLIESDKYIYVLWNYNFTYEGYESFVLPPYYISIYTREGDFVKNIAVERKKKSCNSGRLVDMGNNNVLLLNYQCCQVINIESGKEIEFRDDVRFVHCYGHFGDTNNRRIKFYDNKLFEFGDIFSIYDWSSQEKIAAPVDLIDLAFPDETYKPKFMYTCDEMFSDKGVDFFFRVILYNGEQRTVHALFDLESNKLVLKK